MVLPGGRALHEQGSTVTDLGRIRRCRARQGATLDKGGTEGVNSGIDGAGHNLNDPAPGRACQELSRPALLIGPQPPLSCCDVREAYARPSRSWLDSVLVAPRWEARTGDPL